MVSILSSLDNVNGGDETPERYVHGMAIRTTRCDIVLSAATQRLDTDSWINFEYGHLLC